MSEVMGEQNSFVFFCLSILCENRLEIAYKWIQSSDMQSICYTGICTALHTHSQDGSHSRHMHSAWKQCTRIEKCKNQYQTYTEKIVCDAILFALIILQVPTSARSKSRTHFDAGEDGFNMSGTKVKWMISGMNLE